jgi:hypothetical protein
VVYKKALHSGHSDPGAALGSQERKVLYRGKKATKAGVYDLSGFNSFNIKNYSKKRKAECSEKPGKGNFFAFGQ